MKTLPPERWMSQMISRLMSRLIVYHPLIAMADYWRPSASIG